MGEFLNSYSDLHLTMFNIELVQVISILYNEFQFHVPRSISFLSYHANTHTHTHTHTHTRARARARARAHTQRERLRLYFYSCVLEKGNYNKHDNTILLTVFMMPEKHYCLILRSQNVAHIVILIC